MINLVKIPKFIVTGHEGICPKCGHTLEQREHKEITKKLLNKQCYFKKWDCCTNCYYVKFEEKDRVWKNKPQKNIIEDEKVRELKEFLKTFDLPIDK